MENAITTAVVYVLAVSAMWHIFACENKFAFQSVEFYCILKRESLYKGTGGFETKLFAMS